jgi:hypothetical protein
MGTKEDLKLVHNVVYDMLRKASRDVGAKRNNV